jgi:predicted  nucleic acid-binding Zn ribbon protein
MLCTYHVVDGGSPIICGTCRKSIPLYKLPNIFDEKEHYEVFNWDENSYNVHELYVNGLSDRFTYRQMNNINSQLSKDGRKICKAFEEATGIPFYYYLFYFDWRLTKTKKTPETCSSCGKNWRFTDEDSCVDFKCDKCRLVADEM